MKRSPSYFNTEPKHLIGRSYDALLKASGP